MLPGSHCIVMSYFKILIGVQCQYAQALSGASTNAKFAYQTWPLTTLQHCLAQQALREGLPGYLSRLLFVAIAEGAGLPSSVGRHCRTAAELL